MFDRLDELCLAYSNALQLGSEGEGDEEGEEVEGAEERKQAVSAFASAAAQQQQ